MYMYVSLLRSKETGRRRGGETETETEKEREGQGDGEGEAEAEAERVYKRARTEDKIRSVYKDPESE